MFWWLLALVCCCCSEISGAVQTGDKVEARDAGDGLFGNVQQQNDDQFTVNTFADDVLQCNPRGNSIFSGEEGVGECLRRRAVTHLLGLSGTASTVGVSDSLSFEASADAAGSRALPPHLLYAEPPSLGEAARHFLGQRIMRWQLDALYPGLVMRVGPIGGHPEHGLLEFVLERIYDDTDRAIGPAKLLMKRTLLPALLGFKLKLSTLMPLLLAGFFFMASKAVFFSKLAILIGATIGLKSLLFGAAGHHLPVGGHHHGAYGLHPVGHSSSDSFLDNLFTSHSGIGVGGGNYNPYGPVSFKSAAVRQSSGVPEVLDPANDHVPRTVEARDAKQAAAPALPTAAPLRQRQAASGKRNFAWEPAV